MTDEQDYLRHVVLSAADQSALDASLIDSIELYHLAGSYDKVVETVNRALGQSLAGASSKNQALESEAQNLGLSGAFGGVSDLGSLASKVHAVYERDFARRTRVSKGNWETLGILLMLKKALAAFAADRPDLALEVSSVLAFSLPIICGGHVDTYRHSKLQTSYH